MHQLSLEIMQTWNVGPLPAVEGPDSGHEHVPYVFELLARGEIKNLDTPFGGVLVPPGLGALVAELYEPPHAIFVGDPLPVPEDLRRFRVKG